MKKGVPKMTYCMRSVTAPIDTRSDRKSRQRSRHRQLFLGLAAALMLSLSAISASGMTSSAYATVGEFNCGVLQVNEWCEYTVAHHYRIIDASYRGSGNAYVCAKFILTNGAYYAESCGTNFAGLGVSPTDLLYPLVQDGGPNPHTIWGIWEY